MLDTTLPVNFVFEEKNWLSEWFSGSLIKWFGLSKNVWISTVLLVLRPVHTKHDNYKDNDKDIVLKIVLSIKE